MKRFAPFVILLCGAIFFLMASYFSFTSWRERVRIGVESVNWPTAPAKFIAGSVEFIGSGSRKDSTPYQAKIRYSYFLNGIAHYSDAIAATSRGFRIREEAQAYLDEYPKDKLTAHYNPLNPSEAVLEIGISPAWHLLALLPIVAGAVAIFLLLEALKNFRNRRKPAT